jgi:5'-nucleotidase
MIKPVTAIALASAIVLPSAAAEARNILISNDDGLTSNVVALHAALEEAGHDVIVSVPCTNQSGMGAALAFDRPLLPLSEACLNDAAQAGDPGVGEMTREGLPEGDFYYVNGTPVMAVMHGIDVAAMERWGAPPDLVLSGPNEGQNVGAVVISSGTVGAAQYAAVRGLPAIALSAGGNSASETLDNPVSALVASRAVELVDALDESAGEGRILPEGLALNVNFPDEPQDAPWRASRIGSYNAYKIGFTTNMAESASPMMRAMAAERGVEVPPLPGLSFQFNTAKPTEEQLADESVVYRSAIAVSPMQAGYGYGEEGRALVADLIADLLLIPSTEAGE